MPVHVSDFIEIPADNIIKNPGRKILINKLPIEYMESQVYGSWMDGAKSVWKYFDGSPFPDGGSDGRYRGAGAGDRYARRMQGQILWET